MKRSPKILLFMIPILLVLTYCKKENTYYDRPASLASPIYQRLKELGRFSNFLSCIDRTSYKSTLNGTGYYTVFAPNDSAFKVFLAARGLSSVDKLDDATATSIVKYSIVFNAYNVAGLVNLQLGNVNGTVFMDSAAFKRKTVYDKGFYTSGIYGSDSVYLDNNTNGTSYVENYYNYKYIPYFSQRYFADSSTNSIRPRDYACLFPNVPLSNLNVVDAKVVTEDIFAENGYIQEVNKVITPLPNIYEYLSSKSNYSLFKSLVDKFAVYTYDAAQTIRYTSLNPSQSGKSVYIKSFGGSFAFSPNNENYNNNPSSGFRTDAQGFGFTMFVPTNDAITSYVQNKLAYYYGGNVNGLPLSILQTFINLHMFSSGLDGCVWPSRFGAAQNYHYEAPLFNYATDITESKLLSNGVFYGASTVQKSQLFESVNGELYLNPNNSIMNQLILSYGGNLQPALLSQSPNGITLCIISNNLMGSNHYGYNPTALNGFVWSWNTGFSPTVNITPSATIGTDTLKELAEMNVITERALPSLSGSGIVRTFGGQAVRYYNGYLIGSGNEDNNSTPAIYNNPAALYPNIGVPASPLTHSSPNNGICYQLSNTRGQVLKDSKCQITYQLQKYFGGMQATVVDTTGNTHKFWAYLCATPLTWSPGSTALAPTLPVRPNSVSNPGFIIPNTVFGNFYAVLVPSDAAIAQAVADHYLPPLPSKYSLTTIGQAKAANHYSDNYSIQKVEKFIQYHFVNTTSLGGCLTPYGAPPKGYGAFISAYRRVTTGFAVVDASPSNSNVGMIAFRDEKGQISNVIAGSGQIGHKCVYYQIDNYLHYDTLKIQ